MHNRFKTGSAAFKCEMCGKLTRDTVNYEAELCLCRHCLLKAYVKNAENDYGADSSQYRQYHQDLVHYEATHKIDN
jgi:ribosome-binding protein aMBF1 (putative translation factor)